MLDGEITAGLALAVAMWVVAAALTVLGLALDTLALITIGLFLSPVAATLNIRCFIVRQNRLLRRLGADRAEGVHQLRS